MTMSWLALKKAIINAVIATAAAIEAGESIARSATAPTRKS
jgi:hypothetical protein